MMFGWFSAEAARASCSNLERRSAFSASSGGRTFSATSLPRRGSRARYTSPIPPAPRADRISYAPRRLPAAIVTARCRSVDRAFRHRVVEKVAAQLAADDAHLPDRRGHDPIAELELQPGSGDDVAMDRAAAPGASRD